MEYNNLSTIKTDAQYSIINRNNSRILRNSHGMTLIEILIAICVFGIGLLAVIAMQSTTFKSTSRSRHLSGSTEKGVALLENLISLPESHAKLSAGLHTPGPEDDFIDNDNNGSADESGEPWDVVVTWVVTDDTPTQEAKSIVVTLTSDAGVKKNVSVGGIKQGTF